MLHGAAASHIPAIILGFPPGLHVAALGQVANLHAFAWIVWMTIAIPPSAGCYEQVIGELEHKKVQKLRVRKISGIDGRD
jgi:hypothetical protein